jgi:hypothetical protein
LVLISVIRGLALIRVIRGLVFDPRNPRPSFAAVG